MSRCLHSPGGFRGGNIPECAAYSTRLAERLRIIRFEF